MVNGLALTTSASYLEWGPVRVVARRASHCTHRSDAAEDPSYGLKLTAVTGVGRGVGEGVGGCTESGRSCQISQRDLW